MDDAIMTAEERMTYVTEDKEAMRAYWRRQMAITDRVGELRFAREEGFGEGKLEGFNSGKVEGFGEGVNESKMAIARNLLAKGSTVEFVHEVTGLDSETIQVLGN